ncbi:hypothetical protein [Paracraurococcus ruber]|uniref:Uncharacterized protein n=1 Tax=Paracraurococcus ruber TaxID=77675 RepID=A0ABS1D3J5_9PROT|nr:hypothetical protein [Paracraurococcus ruber]MBK1661379.1 hypothetical protein [Paracraurococcus ruber]TDG16143.1 hypothetical protein E2C05_29685 [Paracraurococcus ruber]
MDTHRRPGAPFRDSPPILDMTPEGEFRDPSPRRAGPLDRILGQIGGAALVVALIAGGLLLAAVAVFLFSLLLPIAIGAGLVAFASIWWRLRRLRRAGGAPPGAVRFVVLRR